ARQVVAEDALQSRAYRFGTAGIAARLFLDDAFERARDEGHARCLDRLQVARGEKARRGTVEVAATVGEKRIDAAQRAPGRGAYRRRQILLLEPSADRRYHRAEIDDDTVGSHGDRRRTARMAGKPGA